MRIEHVAIYVWDLERMRDFYVSVFGAQCGQHYHNLKTGFQSYFLTFSDGARLELMTVPQMVASSEDVKRSGYIHMAISAGSRQEVDRLTRVLEEKGCAIHSHPRQTGDGYYESCILDPEGNLVEITV